MAEITLSRFKKLDHSTLGLLYVPDPPPAVLPSVFCFTLEDKVREIPGQPVASWKLPGQTAIPAGRYEIVWNFSQHFQREMPELLGVPGFDGVRIHGGNTDADTEGCLIIAYSAAILAGSVSQATACVFAFYARLQAMLATERVFITIKNAA